METLLIVLVPGVLGGLVLALLMARKPTRTARTFVPRRLESPSPALINMAHIRVEGLGGLGMVAAVVAVAIADGRIRAATILAALLGTALALVLIAMRRRTGAMPSSSDGPEDRSILHLDAGERRIAPHAALEEDRRTAGGTPTLSSTDPVWKLATR
jgi:hypothetical protein